MASKVCIIIVFLNIVTISLVKGYVNLTITNQALDQNLFEEVIDPELCHEQIRLIRSNGILALFFADAGIRFPRGIFEGNLMDMGNYHQCIGLNQQLSDNELQGKYCMIRVPMNQSYHFPEWIRYSESFDFDRNLLTLDEETVKSLEQYNAMRKGMLAMSGIVDHDRSLAGSIFSGMELRLAVCIPRPCTTNQAINSFLFNVSAIGFEYTEDFCRLPDDKPWVPGDTVAVVVFSILGLITLLSTSYDVWQTLILKNDPKTVSVIGRSFSVYTNGRRLMTFTSNPGTIECLDGIRTLAMAWVIVGHTFATEENWANPLDAFSWSVSWQALWLMPAHTTVDTFFALSGFLVVYTTVGKLNGNQLLKSIHLFWLNRLLRMFPLLAAAVLLEATFLNRMTDGPIWDFVGSWVHGCRINWWATLLHIQNYATSYDPCLSHTWYLAIDVQLHILSPIILYWVLLGNKKIAWGALLTALVAILVASTTYNFIKAFPSTMILAARSPEGPEDYLFNYYVNTLTRSSPFFVGMLFGYLVKTVKLEMSKIGAVCFWIATFSWSTFIIYTNYPIVQPNWDNQLMDNLFNSFIRPAWALFVCTIIYACVNGYGGPINWFLSLSVWKIQSRLSYAMYLFHYALIAGINSSAIAPVYFTVDSMIFKFLAYYSLSFLVAFFMVLVVDSPFSTLFKLLLGGGAKKPRKKEIDVEQTKEIDDKQV